MIKSFESAKLEKFSHIKLSCLELLAKIVLILQLIYAIKNK